MKDTLNVEPGTRLVAPSRSVHRKAQPYPMFDTEQELAEELARDRVEAAKSLIGTKCPTCGLVDGWHSDMCRKLNRTASEAVAERRQELRDIAEGAMPGVKPGTMPTPGSLAEYHAELEAQAKQYNPKWVGRAIDCLQYPEHPACQPITSEEERETNRIFSKMVDKLVENPKPKSLILERVNKLNDEATQHLNEVEFGEGTHQELMPTPKERKELKEGDSPFHFESGKPRMDQLPPRALIEVAKVFTYGAKKYGDWNWAQYAAEWTWGQLLGSTMRHLFAWMMREELDHESGLPHLAHAAADVMMMLELIINRKGTDDRNPIYQTTGALNEVEEISHEIIEGLEVIEEEARQRIAERTARELARTAKA